MGAPGLPEYEHENSKFTKMKGRPSHQRGVLIKGGAMCYASWDSSFTRGDSMSPPWLVVLQAVRGLHRPREGLQLLRVRRCLLGGGVRGPSSGPFDRVHPNLLSRESTRGRNASSIRGFGSVRLIVHALRVEL